MRCCFSSKKRDPDTLLRSLGCNLRFKFSRPFRFLTDCSGQYRVLLTATLIIATYCRKCHDPATPGTKCDPVRLFDSLLLVDVLPESLLQPRREIHPLPYFGRVEEKAFIRSKNKLKFSCDVHCSLSWVFVGTAAVGLRSVATNAYVTYNIQWLESNKTCVSTITDQEAWW